jgi:hypothetical protein
MGFRRRSMAVEMEALPSTPTGSTREFILFWKIMKTH